jgi:translation elongation factor EF-4
LAIIGNKVDLETADVIPYEEARQYASELGAVFHYTSAKDGKGIQEMFEGIAEKLLTIKEANSGGKEKLRGQRRREGKKCC